MPIIQRRQNHLSPSLWLSTMSFVLGLFLFLNTSSVAQAQTGTALSEFGKNYGAFFPVITGLLTVFVIYLSVRVSRQIGALSKQLAEKSQDLQLELHQDSIKQQRQALEGNVLLVCNDRYDKMWELVWQAQQKAPSDAQANLLYRRYWGLQHDQFQYFKDGLVSEEKFRYWLRARYMDYHRADPMRIGNVDYVRGWNNIRTSSDIPDALFYEVLDRAMDIHKDHGSRDLAVDAAIKHYRAESKKQS